MSICNMRGTASWVACCASCQLTCFCKFGFSSRNNILKEMQLKLMSSVMRHSLGIIILLLLRRLRLDLRLDSPGAPIEFHQILLEGMCLSFKHYRFVCQHLPSIAEPISTKTYPLISLISSVSACSLATFRSPPSSRFPPHPIFESLTPYSNP